MTDNQEMNLSNRETIIKDILNLEEKKWNTHMLRTCTKLLINIPKKDFKNQRWSSVITKDIKAEKNILQQMLINKSKTLNESEWNIFHKKLIHFSNRSHIHPRNKTLTFLSEC